MRTHSILFNALEKFKYQNSLLLKAGKIPWLISYFNPCFELAQPSSVEVRVERIGTEITPSSGELIQGTRAETLSLFAFSYPLCSNINQVSRSEEEWVTSTWLTNSSSLTRAQGMKWVCSVCLIYSQGHIPWCIPSYKTRHSSFFILLFTPTPISIQYSFHEFLPGWPLVCPRLDHGITFFSAQTEVGNPSCHYMSGLMIQVSSLESCKVFLWW